MARGVYDRSKLRRPLAERFWPKVDVRGEDECWLWLASCSSGGYGQIMDPDRKAPLRAHRVAWELTRGPIPDGKVLDHLCRNKRCVNPAHLEVVTHGENSLRGTGSPAVNARKTHCKRGHPLSGDNLYRRANGQRICRTCQRILRERSRGEPRVVAQ